MKYMYNFVIFIFISICAPSLASGGQDRTLDYTEIQLGQNAKVSVHLVDGELRAFVDGLIPNGDSAIEEGLEFARDAIAGLVSYDRFKTNSPLQSASPWRRIIINVSIGSAGNNILPTFSIIWEPLMSDVQRVASSDLEEFLNLVRYNGANYKGEELLYSHCHGGEKNYFCLASIADYCISDRRNSIECLRFRSSFLGAIDERFLPNLNDNLGFD